MQYVQMTSFSHLEKLFVKIAKTEEAIELLLQQEFFCVSGSARLQIPCRECSSEPKPGFTQGLL